jgi:hypothetical protein
MDVGHENEAEFVSGPGCRGLVGVAGCGKEEDCCDGDTAEEEGFDSHGSDFIFRSQDKDFSQIKSTDFHRLNLEI